MSSNDSNLEEWMQGDTFVTKEQREEAAAERRRQQRRERLRRLEQSSSSPTTTRAEVDTPRQTKSDNLLKPDNNNNNNENEEDNNDDNDDFDMFSSSVSPVAAPTTVNANTTTTTIATTSTTNNNNQDDYDDAEGYYKTVLGETLSLLQNSIQLRVASLIGKGVFSTVIQCDVVSNSSSVALPKTVALKCIRHNETMSRAAAQELEFLWQLQGSPGIVPLLLPQKNADNRTNNTTTRPAVLEHRGHVILVFEYQPYNLRDVLQKFGKGVGLSLTAVRSYYGQLLAAATHLVRHGILHADIKPDNILVSHDFGVVQLADLGSAMAASTSSSSTSTTPYLVSRYYRAPEIILGLPPTFAMDLWSLAVTVAEVFLGQVVFQGRSNNDMLYLFLQSNGGAISNRLIRQHLVACQKQGVGGSNTAAAAGNNRNNNQLLVPHFRPDGAQYVFLRQTADPVTQVAVHQECALHSFALTSTTTTTSSSKPKQGLSQRISKAKSASDPKYMVGQFTDLLQQCLALDPAKRIAVKDALRHAFFASRKQKAE